MKKNQGFQNRLVYAFAGLREGLAENSFKTQLVFAVGAILALFILKPALIWWALVIVMCVAVLSAELFNTALEALCDHVSTDFQPAIKVAKDTAAAAVLVLSVGALIVAGLMLLSVFR